MTSTADVPDAVREYARTTGAWDAAAIASLGVCSVASLAVLYHVAAVTGTRDALVAVVAFAVLLAVAARPLSHLQATAVAVLLLAAGLTVYLTTVPAAYLDALSANRVVQDMVALLTGFPVLRMPAAGTWALAVAPGPTFLTWYFGTRREFVRATTVAGATLGFFVLTGDSGSIGTLAGVTGATGAVAFATLGQHGGSRRHLELVALLLAVMIVASTTVTAVPGGRTPIVPTSSAPGSLVSASDSVGVGGSISLSPKVQFVVESDEPRYWRVAAYDRYVGDGWVRTGEPGSGAARAGGPVGPTRTVTQRYTVKRPLDAVPAAASPVDVDGIDATRTGFGDYIPAEQLEVNETYTVISEVPVTTTLALRTAGTDYPAAVEKYYTSAPATTPRVRRLAANITRGEQTPYAKAVAIEAWLEANKQYSLDAPAPSGNVVDAFLFEQNVGYCTYYASAMVVMLRAEGVPARFVTGYSTGQRVGPNEYVVRGVDSHAWVEVYFPDVGWVRFDPTPAAPRTSEEEDIVEDARREGVAGVDAAGSVNGTWTPGADTPDPADSTTNGTATGPASGVENVPRSAPSGFAGRGTTTNATTTLPAGIADPAGTISQSRGTGGPGIPSPRVLTVWGVLAAGFLAGVRRTGIPARAYRWLWLRTTPRGDPAARIEGAFARTTYLLERRYRPRRSGETVREYLDAIDAPESARRVAAIRERATYRNDATTAAAADAIEHAKTFTAQATRIA